MVKLFRKKNKNGSYSKKSDVSDNRENIPESGADEIEAGENNIADLSVESGVSGSVSASGDSGDISGDADTTGKQPVPEEDFSENTADAGSSVDTDNKSDKNIGKVFSGKESKKRLYAKRSGGEHDGLDVSSGVSEENGETLHDTGFSGVVIEEIPLGVPGEPEEDTDKSKSSGGDDKVSGSENRENKENKENGGAPEDEQKTAGKSSKPRRWKNNSNADTELDPIDRVERFCFRFITGILAASLIFLLGKCLYPFFRDVFLNEYREPVLYQSNGHFTEYNLKLNFIPEISENMSFPVAISDEVSLVDITAGPGSVLDMHYLVSDDFLLEQDPADVAEYMCSSRFIREQILTRVDTYRISYYTDKGLDSFLEISEENCAGTPYK